MSIEYKIANGAIARNIDPQSLPWPDDSKVIYAFENDQIVGRLAIMFLPHIEGAWIREDKRNGILLTRLFEQVEQILKQDSRTTALSFIKEDEINIIDLAVKQKYKQLPYKVFLKDLEV